MHSQLELLLNRALKLAEKTEALAENDHATMLAWRIRESVEFCRQQNPKKPLVVSLTGGTGVGKSFIFSRLAGSKNLSPSSDSVRGFTRNPVAAASESHRAFLPFKGDEAEFVSPVIDDAILIDTPDLDSINESNRSLAHTTIACSDIIVFVTSPDKRSDFSIHQQILQWASRKRWFFVMNKIDLTTDVSVDSLKTDYLKRLQKLGFRPDQSALFLFSAKDTDSEEFNRFRQSLFSTHPAELSRQLYLQACLRHLLFPFSDSAQIDALQKTRLETINFMTTLETRLAHAEKLVLAGDKLAESWRNEMQARIYQLLKNRTTAFLYPLIALAGLTGLLKSEEKSRQFIEANLYQNQAIKSCFADSARFINEKKLTPQNATSDHSLYCQRRAEEVYTSTINRFSDFVYSGRLTFYILAGNILPLVIFIQAMYRSVITWTSGTWLPSDFFVHALALIIASILPGCLLLARGIKNISNNAAVDIPETNSQVFSSIIKNNESLDEILQNSSEISSECKSILSQTEKLLPASVCGISQVIDPEPLNHPQRHTTLE